MFSVKSTATVTRRIICSPRLCRWLLSILLLIASAISGSGANLTEQLTHSTPDYLGSPVSAGTIQSDVSFTSFSTNTTEERSFATSRSTPSREHTSSLDDTVQSTLAEDNLQSTFAQDFMQTTLAEDTMPTTLAEDTMQTTWAEDIMQTTLAEDFMQTFLEDDNLQTTLAEDNLQTTLAEDIMRTTLAEDTMQTTLAEDFMQTTLAEDFKQTTLAEDFMQTTLADNIMQTTLAEDIMQTTLAEDFMQTTLSEDFMQTTLADDNLQTTLAEDFMQTHLAQDTMQTTEDVTDATSPTIIDDFSENVTLSQPEILSCLYNYGNLHISATSLDIIYFQNEDGTAVILDETVSCFIHVTVPSDTVVFGHMDAQTACSNENGFYVYDGSADAFRRFFTVDGCEEVEDFYTATRFLYLEVRIGEMTAEFSIDVQLRSVPASDKPQLDLLWMSSRIGYVQTPDFHEADEYPPWMDSWVKVAVPDGHVVFVSFKSLHVEESPTACIFDAVNIYVGGNTTEFQVLKVCGTVAPPPGIYSTDVLYVHFESDYNTQLTGFRLLYSFHKMTEEPQLLENGLWNCSVPYWPRFQLHLACNLLTECLTAEDENNCSFTGVCADTDDTTENKATGITGLNEGEDQVYLNESTVDDHGLATTLTTNNKLTSKFEEGTGESTTTGFDQTTNELTTTTFQPKTTTTTVRPTTTTTTTTSPSTTTNNDMQQNGSSSDKASNFVTLPTTTTTFPPTTTTFPPTTTTTFPPTTTTSPPTTTTTFPPATTTTFPPTTTTTFPPTTTTSPPTPTTTVNDMQQNGSSIDNNKSPNFVTQRITVSDKCYVYVRPASNLTWNEAYIGCATLGARLASFNTPQEWEDVTDTLSMGRMSHSVFVGLKSPATRLPQMYRHILQWADSTIAYFTVHYAENVMFPACATLPAGDVSYMELGGCNSVKDAHFLCELDSNPEGQNDEVGVNRGIQLAGVSAGAVLNIGVSSVVCPSGHLTHSFLACDAESACWSQGYEPGPDSSRSFWTTPRRASCPAPMTSLPPSYACATGSERVPYSLVCDHRADCADASDEEFCDFPSCTSGGRLLLQCGSGQCVSLESRCDGQAQCTDESDEEECAKMLSEDVEVMSPPAVIDLDGRGGFTVLPLSTAAVHADNQSTQVLDPCPQTHFQCPGGGYCLPVYLRCNGVHDCPGKEDEAGCSSYKCPGFYRCRASTICVHPKHVCDGFFQCPQQDDELFCDLTCPPGCTCHGHSFTCSKAFSARLYTQIRYLDATGTGMAPDSVTSNTMLVHLSLSRCGLAELTPLALPNLHSLDLSYNSITSITGTQLEDLPQLHVLSLKGNPLTSVFGVTVGVTLLKMTELDLSNVAIKSLDVRVLALFPNLQRLNISDCGIEVIEDPGFRTLNTLAVLDLRGSAVTQFPVGIFSGLNQLRSVFADNYKLCCPETLPESFNQNDCQAPFNEISSCESLLRSDVYRIFLSAFAILALLGNLGSFVARAIIHRRTSSSGFGVFVTHLCVADFLMGVYLAMIGVADRLYQGTYLWEDNHWRNSAACTVAGFLSLLSSEVSALIICLITLDRFMVLRFPLHGLHFRKGSAQVACVVVWVIGLALSSVPLLPWTAHWRFYSQTGICIPLPITRNDFAGNGYAFGIMIVFNFILFMLIAAGQAVIYQSIRANSMQATEETTKASKDLSIARRLITIAMTDFLCWFPIGLLGLLASQGTPIPGEVNVGMAIFVLPLNSALNPFLYTLNMVLERRRRVQEQRLFKMLLARSKLAAAVNVKVTKARNGAADVTTTNESDVTTANGSDVTTANGSDVLQQTEVTSPAKLVVF